MFAGIILIISIILLITGLSDMNLPLIVVSTIIIFFSMVPLNKKYLDKRREKDE